jgi:hypothetical protein
MRRSTLWNELQRSMLFVLLTVNSDDTFSCGASHFRDCDIRKATAQTA